VFATAELSALSIRATWPLCSMTSSTVVSFHSVKSTVGQCFWWCF